MNKNFRKKGFTLAEVLVAKRVSDKASSLRLVRASEPKVPTKIINKLCAFTLAEVTMAKRVSDKASSLRLVRVSEPKAPTKIINKLCAFTLAEVLITLAIIGVVAAITIPTLLKGDFLSQYEKREIVLKKNLQTALQMMQMDDKLSGYASTEDFVNEFTKYFKVAKRCDSKKLDNCFASEFTTSDDSKTWQINKFSSSASLAKDYTDKNVGLVSMNGVSMILSFNKDCNISGYSIQGAPGLSCLAIMYDLNGKQKPNSTKTDGTGDKDIRFLNAGFGCDGIELSGICWESSFSEVCNTVNGFTWNGANNYCKSIGKRLPTVAELKTVSAAGKVAEMGFNWFGYWTSSPGESYVFSRSTTHTIGNLNYPPGNTCARCVE